MLGCVTGKDNFRTKDQGHTLDLVTGTLGQHWAESSLEIIASVSSKGRVYDAKRVDFRGREDASTQNIHCRAVNTGMLVSGSHNIRGSMFCELAIVSDCALHSLRDIAEPDLCSAGVQNSM